MNDDELDADPRDSLTGQPTVFAEPRHSVLTPIGAVESAGSFARGLGARRVKIALAAGGGMVMLLAGRAVLL